MKAQPKAFVYPSRQLTTHDGLAQMQVRDLQLDEDGFLWVATQGGLSRYDGTHFRSYGREDGLPEEMIIQVQVDNGKVWGVTHTELFSFDGIRCQSYSFEENGVKRNVFPLFSDPKGKFWVTVGKRFFILDKGSFKNPADVYPELASLTFQFAIGSPNYPKIYLADDRNLFYVFSPEDGKLQVDSTTLKDLDVISGYVYSPLQDLESAVFLSWNPYLGHLTHMFRIRADTLLEVAHFDTVSQELKAVHPDAPLAITGSFYGSHSTMIRKKDSYFLSSQFSFSNIRFCFPREDRFYLGTDHGLVIGIKNGLEILDRPLCENTWSIAPRPNGNLLVGCYLNGVHEIAPDGSQVAEYPFPASKMDGFVYQLLTNFAAGPRQLFGSIRGFFWLGEGDRQLNHFYLPTPVEALTYHSESDSYFAAGEQEVYRLPSSLDSIRASIPIPASILATINPNDIAVSSKEHIWIAGNAGLGCFKPQENAWSTYEKQTGKLPCKAAISLAFSEEGKLWAGAECGLLLYDARADSFRLVAPAISERISNVVPLPDKRLALTTQDALFLATYDQDSVYITHSFNQQNGFGLLEPAENGAVFHRGFIWIPATNGLQRLNLSELVQPPYPIRIRLDRIGSIPVPFSFQKDSTLKVEGSSHLLSFSAVNYGASKLQYQLSVNGSDFSQLQDSPEFLLTHLRHGKNRITIRAIGGLNRDQVEDFSFSLQARLPFPARRSAKILIGLLALSALILIIFFYLQHIREKSRRQELQRSLHINRLKTIQAYLNPHFLFNTLTSIQNAILNKDRSEGNRMILSLSKLLRQVLDLGREEKDPATPFNLVSLRQETQMIREYLYLESVQQEPPIKYTIELAPELDQDRIHIPPLIIQPLLENAIIHAFPGKQPAKLITLTISENQRKLRFEMADNGIGIQHAGLMEKQNSMGLKLVKQRLAIMKNLGFDNTFSIQKNEPTGTRIILEMQIIYESPYR